MPGTAAPRDRSSDHEIRVDAHTQASSAVAAPSSALSADSGVPERPTWGGSALGYFRGGGTHFFILNIFRTDFQVSQPFPDLPIQEAATGASRCESSTGQRSGEVANREYLVLISPHMTVMCWDRIGTRNSQSTTCPPRVRHCQTRTGFVVD